MNDAGERILLWPDGAPGALARPTESPAHTGAGPGAKGDSDADRPAITPFLLEGKWPHPCVIVCPGGGYGHLAPHEGGPVARWLNGVGIAAFVLEYRVAPYRHPFPLMDVQRAVRLVRARAVEWRVDRGRIGILGFSAGGHLAACASTLFETGDPDAADPIARETTRPDACVLCYPVITFGEHRNDGSMRNLLGPDADDTDTRRTLSLETRVTSYNPPTFLWHTADDPGVPVENSLLFARALGGSGVPFELHVFPHGEHGLGLAEGHPRVSEWTALCAKWLAGIGFGS